jgi:hypothetical protein
VWQIGPAQKGRKILDSSQVRERKISITIVAFRFLRVWGLRAGTTTHLRLAIDYFIMMVPSSNNNGSASGYLDFFDETGATQSQQPTVLSANLLGIDESPQLMQPRQNQQHVINANHATVSIVTSGAIAPNIAGLGKIAPSSPNMTQRTNEPKSKPKQIYVPAYSCNGGMDTITRGVYT